MLRVVGVPETEFEELGGAQRGTDGVLRGDGHAQRAGNALGLGALPVGGDELQVPSVLGTDALLGLRTQGPKRGHGPGAPCCLGAVLWPLPHLPQTPHLLGITTPPPPTRGQLGMATYSSGGQGMGLPICSTPASLCLQVMHPWKEGSARTPPRLQPPTWAHWELRAEATNKRGKNGPQTKVGDQLTGQASGVTAGVLSASRVPRRGCGRA